MKIQVQISWVGQSTSIRLVCPLVALFFAFMYLYFVASCILQLCLYFVAFFIFKKWIEALVNEYFPITILTSWLRANTHNSSPERTPTWRLEFKFLVCVSLTSLTGTWNCDKDTCHPQRFAECICICICPDWIIPPPSTNALVRSSWQGLVEMLSKVLVVLNSTAPLFIFQTSFLNAPCLSVGLFLLNSIFMTRPQ